VSITSAPRRLNLIIRSRSYRLAARDVAAAVEAAPAEPASKIRLQLYGTKRRLKSEGNDPPGEFKPYLLVELGTENRDVLSAVVNHDSTRPI